VEILNWSKFFIRDCPNYLPPAPTGKFRVLAKDVEKGAVCLEPPYDGRAAWYGDTGLDWPLGAKVRVKFVPGEVCGEGELQIEPLSDDTSHIPASVSAFDNALAAYNW